MNELKRADFSATEGEALVREYLATPEAPLCPGCGEEVRFRLEYLGAGPATVRVACPGCARGFAWTQPRPADDWTEVHLRYFLERVRKGGEIRCPLDDCRVVWCEHSEGSLEFRCVYCGRRRLAPRPNRDAHLTSNENESIVFLIT